MVFFEKFLKGELVGLFDQDLYISVRVELVQLGNGCLDASLPNLSIDCQFLSEAVHAVGSHFLYAYCNAGLFLYCHKHAVVLFCGDSGKRFEAILY